MTGVAKTADDYPTFQITDGKAGKCLSLVTRSTGFFGQIAGMPIAAGNLFIGSFDVSNAMSNPLKATKFGLPFRHVPTYLAGYYKYKAGDQFTEGGKPVNGKRDICDIYAIMYETSESVPTLDGTNAFTSPNLISTARINNAKETNEWTYFKLPFTTLPGKFIDKEKLMDGKYNIAIVFTSSLEGDRFNGAIGSTLLIDDTRVNLSLGRLVELNNFITTKTMKIYPYIFSLLTCIGIALPGYAQVDRNETLIRSALHGLEYEIKAGFSIGGTAPLPLPVEIRSIDGYNPTLAISIGGEVTKWIAVQNKLGIIVGLRLENKAMTTEATVKNYNMEILGQGGERISGVWTGGVKPKYILPD